jgi:predicted nucleic-acid-binding Zn-ribbon protein
MSLECYSRVMRKNFTCPKCESKAVGHISRVDGQGRSVAISVENKTFLPKQFSAPVEAYVCTSCGFFEEYVKDPGAVEWNKLTDFRWCRPSEQEDGPFR